MFCWYKADFLFAMKTLDQDTGAKLIQIGTVINYLAALLMAIRYLWQTRYDIREKQILKISEELDRYYEWAKISIQSEKEIDNLDKKIEVERDKHYKELEKVYSLDKIELAHVVLGLVALFVGSALQIIGTGAAG